MSAPTPVPRTSDEQRPPASRGTPSVATSGRTASKDVRSLPQQKLAVSLSTAGACALGALTVGVVLWRIIKTVAGGGRHRSRRPAAGKRPGVRAAQVAADTSSSASEPTTSTASGKAKTKAQNKVKAAPTPAAKGPCSGLKASSKCVPLEDGSACVVRREIPADNSCLFNAVGYVMHHSKSKASFLRGVVAREVSSDPETYSSAFLGMNNTAYCAWIQNRLNWGGGIELSILCKHYHREIAAWNIETSKQHVFGEEQGYPKQVMLIYNGVHYDALAIAAGPRAPESDDITEFNPRTKRGKMIIAAAQKLVELTHRGSQFYAPDSMKTKCNDCSATFKNQQEAMKHAQTTGHTNFEQVK